MITRIRNGAVNLLFTVLTVLAAFAVYISIVTKDTYITGLGALYYDTQAEQGGIIKVLRLVEVPQSDICRIQVNRELISTSDMSQRYSLPGTSRATVTAFKQRLLREYQTQVPDDIPPGEYMYVATSYYDCKLSLWRHKTITEFEPFLVKIIAKK